MYEFMMSGLPDWRGNAVIMKHTYPYFLLSSPFMHTIFANECIYYMNFFFLKKI